MSSPRTHDPIHGDHDHYIVWGASRTEPIGMGSAHAAVTVGTTTLTSAPGPSAGGRRRGETPRSTGPAGGERRKYPRWTPALSEQETVARGPAASAATVAAGAAAAAAASACCCFSLEWEARDRFPRPVSASPGPSLWRRRRVNAAACHSSLSANADSGAGRSAAAAPISPAAAGTGSHEFWSDMLTRNASSCGETLRFHSNPVDKSGVPVSH